MLLACLDAARDFHVQPRAGRGCAGHGGNIIPLEGQRRAVRFDHFGHLPGSRNAETEVELVFGLRHQEHRARIAKLLFGERQKSAGSDAQLDRRPDELGCELVFARGCIEADRLPDRRRARLGLKNRLRNCRRERVGIDRDQAGGGDPLRIEAILNEQAHHRHLARHIERHQPRQRPLFECRRRARRGNLQHDRFGRRLAQDRFQHGRHGVFLHFPAGQQRRHGLRDLKAGRQLEAELIHRPVQHAVRHRGVQPLVPLRHLGHEHARGQHDAPLLEHLVVQRHDDAHRSTLRQQLQPRDVGSRIERG
jgi:hypothetical protein